MTLNKENIPLDAQLLSDAIIELNISRRNVFIYPKNHPIVERSLDRAFHFLQELFDLREEITVAVAKDTLIVDSHHLDKQNPVYREFAQCLSEINITYVTFIKGITKDELYSFHQFILTGIQISDTRDVRDLYKEFTMPDIQIGFIDFSAFHLVEGLAGQGTQEGALWERYVFGVLEGSLQTEEAADVIQTIPPQSLAALMNSTALESMKQESYDGIITSYLRRSSGRSFSSKELKKLLDFIHDLKPELKKQFLSSSVNTVLNDTDSAEKMFRDMSIDDVLNFLNMINEQLVAIPEALKNVLDKFASLPDDNFNTLRYGNGLIQDDIFLSPEITSLLEDANFSAFVTESYQQEIQRLLKYDAKPPESQWIKEFEKEWTDEYIEGVHHQIILELMVSDRSGIIPPEDYETFRTILMDQTEQCMHTGQYNQILNAFQALEANISKNHLHDLSYGILEYFHSGPFIASLIDSIRIMGRAMRDDVLLLCKQYGDKIVPQLMDALIDEESPSVRRFIISLIVHFRAAAVSEAVKHLDDERWYIIRNMLYIINECDGGKDFLQQIRPYCYHDNYKVRYEATKCLIKNKDSFGTESLIHCLRADSKALVASALSLSGACKVVDVVPELMRMLRKKSLTGTDFENKIPIVKTLGQIGDPRALDALNRILSAKTLLFKGSLEKLKNAVYSTLKNYPDGAVNNLMHGNNRADSN